MLGNQIFLLFCIFRCVGISSTYPGQFVSWLVGWSVISRYTESQGYECVPYYQCHNWTFTTDGKCPGFLDVCCLDPDFIPPPPILQRGLF